MHYLDANQTAGEEARRQLHKNVASNIEQVLEVTPHKAPTIWPPASHHENYPNMIYTHDIYILKLTNYLHHQIFLTSSFLLLISNLSAFILFFETWIFTILLVTN